MCGIYSIKCKTTNKYYIGASVNIKRRWNQHKRSHINEKCYNYPLYIDMRKYGIDDFEFSIIEECEKDELEEREMYYIDKYDSYVNGYNQNMGGEYAAINPKETTIGIIYDLENTHMKHKEIAEKWGTSVEMVQGINTGRHWKHDREYPIQKKKEAKKHLCKCCGKEISRKSNMCVECYKNSVKKISDDDIDLIKQLIVKYKAISPVARYFNVSDNYIRKICKKNNILYKRDDINPKKHRNSKNIK